MTSQGALLFFLFGSALAPAVVLVGCGEDPFLVEGTDAGSPDATSFDATGHGDTDASVDGVASSDAQDARGASPDAGEDAFADAAVGDAAIEAADAWDAADGLDAPDGFTCDPAKSPYDDRCVLSETLGVFVSPSGLDTNPGTRAAPLRTITSALIRASVLGVGRVYACQGGYAETVRLASPVSVFGGLDCASGADWRYGDGGPSQVAGAANAVAWTVDGVDAAVALEDLRIVGPDAVGQDPAGNGRSSIAVLLNGLVVAMRRCTFVAGAGSAGGDTAAGSNYVLAVAPLGQPDDAGVGGAGGLIVCADGTSSAGGAGGDPTTTSGGRGSAVPTAAPSGSYDGLGGAREVSACGQGDPGANGDPGSAGGAATTAGAWSDAGWKPSAGGAGGDGHPGQGGGGGGAVSLTSQAGAGGGAGGCGGAGGAGGGGGGASIALACLDGSVVLEGCVLLSADAGSGGPGSVGQGGQAGGTAGMVQAVMGCSGGVGGNGGGGGGGAGGNGGVSACILYRGSAPVGTVTCSAGGGGAGGAGGPGGAGGVNANVSALQGLGGSPGIAGVSATEIATP